MTSAPQFESINSSALSLLYGPALISVYDYWKTIALTTENNEESHSVMSNFLQPHGLHSPWNSLGQNTGVGSLFLLQGIFPNQGSNPGLPHCRQILYQLSHKGSPKLKSPSCIQFCNPMDYKVHRILQARKLEGSLSLLQGIFPTQGSSPGLPYGRQILYQLSHNRSPCGLLKQ